MLRIPLTTDDTSLLLTPRAADLGPTWQIAVLSLLLLVPAALVAWLYRHELRLVRKAHASGLLCVRLLLLLLLWSVIALQPTLSHVGTEAVPSRVVIAVDVSGSMDVVDVQRSDDENAELARVLDASKSEAAGWSRRQVAQRLLGSRGLNLLEQLGRRHQVELAAFDERRRTVAPSMADTLLAAADTPRATDLRLALESSGSVPPLAIVVLTDGRHNRGPAPVERARQLGIPIYPILLGAKRPPPDLLVADVQAPDKVFKDTTLPVAARIQVRHLPAQELTVELTVQGKTIRPEDRRRIAHPGGDAVYEMKFELPMTEAGVRVIEVRATAAQGGEITLANNVRRRSVVVAEDKARVLLVDAEARWEYYYLAAALERDRAVRLERVLFAPPQLGLLRSEEERGNLPRLRLPAVTEKAEPLLDYDCILLGDVGPEQLPTVDRRRIERFVAERGGTLILVAGKRAMPLAYTQPPTPDDPLLKLLPIREPRVVERKDGFTLQLTEEGKRAPFLRLDPEAPIGLPELPMHYWAVVGKRQPGATVLATPANESAGLLVQQPYGLGKVVFVGLDSTWRWRYRVGDTYHHRFWGQLVRWAGAERLLPAGDAYARFGTREPVYRVGEPITVAVRLTGVGANAVTADSERAVVERVQPDGTTRHVAVVPLMAKPGQRRLLEGRLEGLPAGNYTVRYHPGMSAGAVTPSAPAIPTFTVLAEENGELLDLSTNADLLRTLADATQGRLFTVTDAAQLVDLLAQMVQPREVRQDSRPWQDEPFVWWTLGVLLGLLTLEWAWRKRLGLP